MKRMIKSIFSFVLIFAMLCASAGYAAETESKPAAKEEEQTGEQSAAEQMSILDEERLNKAVEELLAGYGISGDRLQDFSFAYTYPATGDSWYYNADVWRYSASMYKVPMMMVLAEREAQGELTRESDLGGIQLGKAEELILILSNNEYAHVVRKYLGGDSEARKLYQRYSPLEESYYHPDFMDYCYFTARYMNDVMETLYREPERFPNILECLTQAMPQNFFHLKIDPAYAVAQKYGSFQEQTGTFYNNNSGIIYTPNPFILTVMTENLSYEKAEQLIGDAAKLFVDYTLELDGKLSAYEEEVESAQEEAEEAERLAAEEAERRAREEAAAKEAAERERLAEQQRREEEAAAAAKREKLLSTAKKAGALLLVLGVTVFLIVSHVRKKRRQREWEQRKEWERRRRWGLEEEAPDRSAGRKAYSRDEYRPRH